MPAVVVPSHLLLSRFGAEPPVAVAAVVVAVLPPSPPLRILANVIVVILIIQPKCQSQVVKLVWGEGQWQQWDLTLTPRHLPCCPGGRCSPSASPWAASAMQATPHRMPTWHHGCRWQPPRNPPPSSPSPSHSLSSLTFSLALQWTTRLLHCLQQIPTPSQFQANQNMCTSTMTTAINQWGVVCNRPQHWQQWQSIKGRWLIIIWLAGLGRESITLSFLRKTS
jgi:hypothetical protein